MRFVMTISTDSWHYRYCSWIREFWGLDPEPKYQKACPYWQTIIWFTVAAVVTSPLIALFYGSFKAAKACFYVMDAILGEGTVGTPNFDPKVKIGTIGRIANKATNFIDTALDSGVTEKVLGGFAVFFGIVLASGFCYLAYEAVCFICHHTIPEIIAYIPVILHQIPAIPGHLYNAALLMGDGIFRMFGAIGGAEEDLVSTIGSGLETAFFASGRGIAFAGREVGIFFTDAPLWENIGRWAGYSAAGLAGCFFAGYTGMEVLKSDLVMNYRRAAAERSKIKVEARNKRLAEAKRLALLEKEKQWEKEKKALKLREAELAEQAPKEKKQRRLSAFDLCVLGIFKKVKNVTDNIWGKTEYVGGTLYESLGIIPLIKTMTVATIKGTCPVVEFLTPAQMEEKRIKAEQDRQLALAKLRAEFEAFNRRMDEANRIMSQNIRCPNCQWAITEPSKLLKEGYACDHCGINFTLKLCGSKERGPFDAKGTPFPMPIEWDETKSGEATPCVYCNNPYSWTIAENELGKLCQCVKCKAKFKAGAAPGYGNVITVPNDVLMGNQYVRCPKCNKYGTKKCNQIKEYTESFKCRDICGAAYTVTWMEGEKTAPDSLWVVRWTNNPNPDKPKGSPAGCFDGSVVAFPVVTNPADKCEGDTSYTPGFRDVQEKQVDPPLKVGSISSVVNILGSDYERCPKCQMAGKTKCKDFGYSPITRYCYSCEANYQMKCINGAITDKNSTWTASYAEISPVAESFLNSSITLKGSDYEQCPKCRKEGIVKCEDLHYSPITRCCNSCGVFYYMDCERRMRGKDGVWVANCSLLPEPAEAEPLQPVKPEAKTVYDYLCPKCGKVMVEKDGKFDQFLACSNWPKCRGAASITEASAEKYERHFCRKAVRLSDLTKAPKLVEPVVACPKCKAAAKFDHTNGKGEKLYECRSLECGIFFNKTLTDKNTAKNKKKMEGYVARSPATNTQGSPSRCPVCNSDQISYGPPEKGLYRGTCRNCPTKWLQAFDLPLINPPCPRCQDILTVSKITAHNGEPAYCCGRCKANFWNPRTVPALLESQNGSYISRSIKVCPVCKNDSFSPCANEDVVFCEKCKKHILKSQLCLLPPVDNWQGSQFISLSAPKFSA